MSLDNNAVPYFNPALPLQCMQAVPRQPTQRGPLLHAHVTPSLSLKTCLQTPRVPLFKSAYMHWVPRHMTSMVVERAKAVCTDIALAG